MPKASIDPMPESVHKGTRYPRDLWMEIERIARERDRPPSYIVREACQEYVDARGKAKP